MALAKTTSDKQAARTQRNFAKKVRNFVKTTAAKYGCEATLEAVQDKLDRDRLNFSHYYKNQVAVNAHASLLCLLREQQWGSEPGNLEVRCDELQPGDQIVDFAYNLSSADRLRAVVAHEVVEVRPDGGVVFADGSLWWPKKPSETRFIHRAE